MESLTAEDTAATLPVCLSAGTGDWASVTGGRPGSR